MKKRIISLLLAVMMIVGMCSVIAMAEEAATEIATVEDLLAFAAAVNGGETTLDAVLTADIDLTGTVWYNYADGSGYMIGNLASPYAGTFDGAGYTISGVDIDVPVTSVPTEEYVSGFFGATDGATIKDLTVAGEVYIYGQQENNLGANGGIIGKAMNTTITGCTSDMDFTGYGYWYYGNYGPNNIGGLIGKAQAVTMDKCVNLGDISLQNTKYVAGLIGHVIAADAATTITNSQNAGNILGTYGVGGLVGFIDGTTGETADTIENCCNTGAVASEYWNRTANEQLGRREGGTVLGGFTGDANVQIVNVYTTAQCYDDGIANTNAETEAFTIDAVYRYGYDDTATHFTNVYYVMGEDTYVGYTRPTSTAVWEAGLIETTDYDLKTKAMAEALGEGFAYNPEGYPVLAWQCEHPLAEAEGDGNGTHTVTGYCACCGASTGASYDEACADEDADFLCDLCSAFVPSDRWYEIADAADLQDFAALVASGATGVNAKLTADVDLTGIDWTWRGIGSLEAPYAGTFDGAGFTISGLNINLNNTTQIDGVNPYDIEHATGLFAATEGATIKNLTVDGTVYIIGNIALQSRHGAVIGKAVDTALIGVISNVEQSGYGWWYYGNNGPHHIGGLVGWGSGVTMDMCANNGNILFYNAKYVAGLIGYVASAATPSSFTRCVNTGDIMASGNYGGLVGYIEGTTGTEPDVIDDCYVTGNVGGRTWNRSANTYAKTFSGGILMNGFASDANVKVTDCFAVGTCYDDGNVYENEVVPSTASGIYHAGYNDSVLQFSNVHFYYDGIVNYTYSVETGINRQSNWATFSNATWVAGMGDAFYLPEGAEHPILKWENCEHTEMENIYANTGHLTHVSSTACAFCGVVGEVSTENEACVDNNYDSICDLCLAATACRHEGEREVTYTATTEGGKHTVITVCADCGGYVLVSDEAEKSVITIDFKAFAKDAAQQDFWGDLKSYDATIATNRFLGRISHAEENLPTVANMMAYAQLRDHLDANYDWNIDEETSMLDSDLKRLHINSSDDVPWGLLWYSYYTGSNPELSKLGFTVYADEAGWYDLTMDTFKINYIYGRAVGDATMSALQAATGDSADAAGGGNVKVLVNDVVAINDYSFNGGQVSVSDSVGAVYLNEGANSIVLEAIYAYNGPTTLYGGRFTVGLNGMTFTEIDAPAMTPETGKLVDPTPYLAVGETVTSDCTVVSADENIATGSISADGKLVINGGAAGYTVLTVKSGDLEIAQVGVTVTESSLVTCVDADADGKCDDCGADMVCAHADVTRTVDYNGDNTHTFTYTCDACCEVAETKTADCEDLDDNLVCDICAAEIDCTHKDTTTVYEDNEDGTHQKMVGCEICTEFIENVAEDHVDELDADGNEGTDEVCDLCGADMTAAPECDHTNTTTATTSNGDKTHTTTVTCECGEVISTETADCADDDKDTACDVCGATIVELTMVNVGGSNMTLGNDLKMNFMVKTAELQDGLTMRVTQEGKEPVVLTPEKYNSTYHYVAYSVAAKEMTDVLTVEVLNADGYVISEEPYTRTIAIYATNLLGKSTTKDALKSVAIDMLNYGTEAQKYFSYNEDDYANANISAEDQEAYATTGATCDVERVLGTNAAGTNLSLEASILLNVFFNSTTTDGMTATVTYTNYKGAEVTAEAAVEKYSSTRVKVVVDEIVLADTKRPVTVTVYQDGVEYGSCTEAVGGYATRKLTDEAMGSICQAILNFATSAYTYLGGTH